MYTDAVFETTWYENMTAKSPRLLALNTQGIEYAGSLEGGYAWKWKRFTVEPQGQVVYQSLSLDDSNDVAAEVDFQSTQSVLGRLGMRLSSTWFLPREVIAWVRTDFWRDFNGKSNTVFSSEVGPVKFGSNVGGNWFEGTFGLTAQITDTLSLYGSFTGNVYLNGRGHSYNGIGGFRAEF